MGSTTTASVPRIRAGVFGKQKDTKKGHPRRGAVRRRAIRSHDDLMRAHLEAKLVLKKNYERKKKKARNSMNTKKSACARVAGSRRAGTVA